MIYDGIDTGLVTQIEAMLKNFLISAAKYDFWSLLSLIILILGTVAGYLKFYRFRRSIRNLTVQFGYKRHPEENFPLRITVWFTNYTGKNIHIASATFKCRELRPDPNAMRDTHTGKMPLKFPKESRLQEFEFYLKVDESAGTYVPIDPKHTDKEIEDAFRHGKVGIFDCYVTLLSRDYKPLVHCLRIKPKENFEVR